MFWSFFPLKTLHNDLWSVWKDGGVGGEKIYGGNKSETIKIFQFSTMCVWYKRWKSRTNISLFCLVEKKKKKKNEMIESVI